MQIRKKGNMYRIAAYKIGTTVEKLIDQVNSGLDNINRSNGCGYHQRGPATVKISLLSLIRPRAETNEQCDYTAKLSKLMAGKKRVLAATPDPSSDFKGFKHSLVHRLQLEEGLAITRECRWYRQRRKALGSLHQFQCSD
jgi:hypothetical protein